MILLPAALVAAAALVVALNWTAIRVAVNPLWALQSGAQRVVELPQPLSLGFLGEVSVGEQSVNTSGVMELQADETGLRVALTDCTVGSELLDITLSAYLSPETVAVRAPKLIDGREGWYGLDLTRPMADQFPLGLGAGFQDTADELRATLSDVTSLTGDEEAIQTMVNFLTQAKRKGERIPGGYVLTFSETREENIQALCRGLGLPESLLTGEVTVDFSLTQKGVLRAVSATSGNMDLFLELGEAPEEELAPRLEAEWTDGEGKPYALTQALTIAQAQPLTPPEYKPFS